MKGFGFRLTGLILGIVGTVISITSIVFSAIGMVKARQYKGLIMGEDIK